MGLYGSFSDVSSDSIPVLMVAIVANCVCYLRSLFSGVLQSVGLSRFDMVDEISDGLLLGDVGSGLAGLVILAEQLKTNQVFSYCESGEDGDAAAAASAGGGFDTDCTVCLSKFRKGEQVRRLECRHLFHKDCLDGWFDQLQWRCPLCRFPLVSDEYVAAAEKKLGRDLITWFSLR